MTNNQKVIVGLGLGLAAYLAMQNPRCREACQEFFQPVATGGGQLAFAGFVGLIGAALA